MYIHKYTIILIYEKKLTWQNKLNVKFFLILFGYYKNYSYISIKICSSEFLLLEVRYTYSKKPLYGV